MLNKYHAAVSKSFSLGKGIPLQQSRITCTC